MPISLGIAASTRPSTCVGVRSTPDLFPRTEEVTVLLGGVAMRFFPRPRSSGSGPGAPSSVGFEVLRRGYWCTKRLLHSWARRRPTRGVRDRPPRCSRPFPGSRRGSTPDSPLEPGGSGQSSTAVDPAWAKRGHSRIQPKACREKGARPTSAHGSMKLNESRIAHRSASRDGCTTPVA